MKRYLYYATLVFFLTGCLTDKEIAGEYYTGMYNRFLLNADNTFAYNYNTQIHISRHSTGFWKIKNKGVLELNSKIQSTIIPVNLSETVVNNRQNIITIKMVINQGERPCDYRCEIHVNNSITISRRGDSLVNIPVTTAVKNISLRFLKKPLQYGDADFYETVESKELRVKNPINANYLLEVMFDDDLFSYQIFNNEYIKINNNSIEKYNTYYKCWDVIPKVKKI